MIKRSFEEKKDKIGLTLNDVNWKFCSDLTQNPDGKYSIDISAKTPAGEDYTTTIAFDGSYPDFVDEIYELTKKFDPNDYAEKTILRKMASDVPRNIQAILDDAKAVEKMLTDLSEIMFAWREQAIVFEDF